MGLFRQVKIFYNMLFYKFKKLVTDFYDNVNIWLLRRILTPTPFLCDILSFLGYTNVELDKVIYLKVMSSCTFPFLQFFRRVLFDFCIRQKNDDFLLEFIRLRGVFSNIPSGSDSTEILERLLFIENLLAKKISNGEYPTRMTEELFWLLFYSELMIERENRD